MAMQSPALKSFLRNAKPLLGLLLLFSFSSCGVCQQISMSCPRPFDNGLITSMNCLIYSLTFAPSYCFSSASVEFFFSNTSVKTRLCQTPYNGPVVSEVVGDMSCAMVTSSREKRTFRLNFRGDQDSHEGGRLTCSIRCTQSPSTTSSEPCGPLEFRNVVVSGTESSCNDFCKAGIVIGVVIVFMIGGFTVKKTRWVQVTAFVEVSTKKTKTFKRSAACGH